MKELSSNHHQRNKKEQTKSERSVRSGDFSFREGTVRREMTTACFSLRQSVLKCPWMTIYPLPSRPLPLQASTSTSDGMLTLDLIQEEDPSPEEPTSCAESFRVDLDKSVAQLAGSRRRADSDRIQPSSDRASGLPRLWEKPDKGATYTPQAPKKLTATEKSRCASLEEILSQRDAAPAHTIQRRAEDPPTPIPHPPGQLSRIQDLVARKLEKTQELLAEVQGLGDGKRKAKEPPRSPPDSESEQLLLETERLLGEASSNWSQAKRVLQEVRELRDLYRQMDLQTPDSHLRQTTQHSQYRKSLM